MAQEYSDKATYAYDPSNPLTSGFGGEVLYNFGNNSGLVNNSTQSVGAWDALSPEAQYYMTKKLGTKMDNTSDVLSAVNNLLKYKGRETIGDISQANDALSPLIAKRNSKVGLGGVLKIAAPIALGLLAPGIGSALAASALGTSLGLSTTAATALAGAGLSGTASALTGGKVLKDAITGGLTAGISSGIGNAAGNVGKTAADGSAVFSSGAPTVMNSPITQSFGPLNNTVLGSAMAKASPYATKAYDALSTASKVGDVISALNPEQQQQQQQQAAPTNNLAFLQQIGNSSGGGALGLAQRTGYAYAEGGRIVVGPGDGMSDGVATTINGNTPAALSDGEHVVPALQVAMLGRGSSNAGSKRVEEIIMNEIKGMYGSSYNPKDMQKIVSDKGSMK